MDSAVIFLRSKCEQTGFVETISANNQGYTAACLLFNVETLVLDVNSGAT
jgi:hypothetical protein